MNEQFHLYEEMITGELELEVQLPLGGELRLVLPRAVVISIQRYKLGPVREQGT